MEPQCRIVVDPSRLSVIVAMPAYNEEGLEEFVREIECALNPHVEELGFVVVDDASESELVVHTHHSLTMVRNEVNEGHGPSVLRAYREALAKSPDVIVHVDGDGQFIGADIARLLQNISSHDVVLGTRHGRTDPWFRRLLSIALRVAAGPSSGDVNTPLRAFRADSVSTLLTRIPTNSLVPHIHWTLLHRRLGLRVACVPVRSIPRRGASSVGSTWSQGRLSRLLPSRRLAWFVFRAALEVAKTRYAPESSSEAVASDVAA